MHTYTIIVDDITNFKLVLMIVIFGDINNSVLMNVSAQNVSFMREIYFFVKKTLIVKKKKLNN